MSINFKPYGNNILIKMDPPTNELLGMEITNKKDKISQTGEIIAVGEGSIDNPMNLKVGEKAFMVKGAGQDVSRLINNESTTPDEKYLVIDRSYVLGTYNK